MTVTQAANVLGVSKDTLYRWDREGRIRTRRDARNRRLIPSEEVERLRGRPVRQPTGDLHSARNRIPGRVVSVEVDGVMALVEIEAGPHRVTAVVIRDSVEEVGLAPGDHVAARVDAIDVMVEREDARSPGAS